MCDLLREYRDAFNGVGELAPELNIKVEEGVDPELLSRRILEALRLPFRDYQDKLFIV